MTGHVSLPQLINKVCERDDRNTIIRLITKQLIDSGRKVLILSDRKRQIETLYDWAEQDGIACGFYVGGMKEAALEKSATKPLIYGTYAMASEGMNIPALDTLILASPKSDIVQSCGRILRTRPEDRINVPLVIDVVDRFPSLERQ